ncbi:hypothetical protein SAMN04487995_3497 [Dyadobacter koreensis]|uniref:Self-protective colicin-like immunity n=1 Tax=Dyadobacter koreensis TaxID=408657 RepID=A0A1H6WRD3_9BACT|nr:hypothetical protein [Dyadobacter koreensis]SEJ15370.1 hypothetical protein SAMN04487995_3497 [Dyadobacter koreensis]
MVSNLKAQTDNLFQELITLLTAESKFDSYNSQFLQYVQEKHHFIQQNTDEAEVLEAIRGINRYSDEFSFTDINTKKIKVTIDNLYNLANRS